MTGTYLQSDVYKRVARKVIREIDPGDFWTWLNGAREGVCKAIAKANGNEEKIGRLISECKDAFYEQTRKQREAMDAP